MIWTALRWVWRLEVPLFIGMPPAGALNRCRPYVPARALWGAVTAELARLDSGKEAFPDYGNFGKEVGANCRFTYLYPAEKVGDNYVAWLPEFERSKGLVWHRQGNQDDEGILDHKFRHCLLDARPGTAIDPETDSASEGTLRETECINPWWRASANRQVKLNPVFLLGYVFLRDNNLRKQLDNINILFVGGDTRYGLGKIYRVGWHDLPGDSSVFGKSVHLDKENPEIQSDIVWGHALEDTRTPIQGMQVMKEILGGWERGSPWKGTLTWAPGSRSGNKLTWAIDNCGYWATSTVRINTAAKTITSLSSK